MTYRTAAMLPPSQTALLDALTAAEHPVSIAQAAKWIGRERGLRLSRVVLAGAMNELCRAGAVDTIDDAGQPRRYILTTPRRAA